jgi:hypothetical protein
MKKRIQAVPKGCLCSYMEYIVEIGRFPQLKWQNDVAECDYFGQKKGAHWLNSARASMNCTTAILAPRKIRSPATDDHTAKHQWSKLRANRRPVWLSRTRSDADSPLVERSKESAHKKFAFCSG